MRQSILQCSGGHWTKAGLVWIGVILTIVVNLPRSEADEPIDSARRLARAAATVVTVAVSEPESVTEIAVVRRVTAFDFNAADMAAYGDVELAEAGARQ